mgnify:CR=1 FL=1
MKVRQKVRMLDDWYELKKGDKVTCCRVEDDGIHYFENKKGQKYYLQSHYYELINETMTKREKLEKAARDIQAQIEALPKNELGWYLGVNNNPFRVTGFTKNNWANVYGFDSNGNWMLNCAQMRMWDSHRLLTESEHKTIKEPALMAEAKKREYKEGVKIKSPLGGIGRITGDIYWANGSKCISVPTDNSVTTGNRYFPLMLDGKWATIIEEPKVFIGGYEMKQEHQKVMFGCMEFSKSNIKALYANCKRLKVQSVMIEGTVVQIDQLKEIVENIED